MIKLKKGENTRQQSIISIMFFSTCLSFNYCNHKCEESKVSLHPNSYRDGRNKNIKRNNS